MSHGTGSKKSAYSPSTGRNLRRRLIWYRIAVTAVIAVLVGFGAYNAVGAVSQVGVSPVSVTVVDKTGKLSTAHIESEVKKTLWRVPVNIGIYIGDPPKRPADRDEGDAPTYDASSSDLTPGFAAVMKYSSELSKKVNLYSNNSVIVYANPRTGETGVHAGNVTDQLMDKLSSSDKGEGPDANLSQSFKKDDARFAVASTLQYQILEHKFSGESVVAAIKDLSSIDEGRVALSPTAKAIFTIVALMAVLPLIWLATKGAAQFFYLRSMSGRLARVSRKERQRLLEHARDIYTKRTEQCEEVASQSDYFPALRPATDMWQTYYVRLAKLFFEVGNTGDKELTSIRYVLTLEDIVELADVVDAGANALYDASARLLNDTKRRDAGLGEDPGLLQGIASQPGESPGEALARTAMEAMLAKASLLDDQGVMESDTGMEAASHGQAPTASQAAHKDGKNAEQADAEQPTGTDAAHSGDSQYRPRHYEKRSRARKKAREGAFANAEHEENRRKRTLAVGLPPLFVALSLTLSVVVGLSAAAAVAATTHISRIDVGSQATPPSYIGNAAVELGPQKGEKLHRVGKVTIEDRAGILANPRQLRNAMGRIAAKNPMTIDIRTLSQKQYFQAMDQAGDAGKFDDGSAIGLAFPDWGKANVGNLPKSDSEQFPPIMAADPNRLTILVIPFDSNSSEGEPANVMTFYYPGPLEKSFPDKTERSLKVFDWMNAINHAAKRGAKGGKIVKHNKAVDTALWNSVVEAAHIDRGLNARDMKALLKKDGKKDALPAPLSRGLYWGLATLAIVFIVGGIPLYIYRKRAFKRERNKQTDRTLTSIVMSDDALKLEMMLIADRWPHYAERIALRQKNWDAAVAWAMDATGFGDRTRSLSDSDAYLVARALRLHMNTLWRTRELLNGDPIAWDRQLRIDSLMSSDDPRIPHEVPAEIWDMDAKKAEEAASFAPASGNGGDGSPSNDHDISEETAQTLQTYENQVGINQAAARMHGFVSDPTTLIDDARWMDSSGALVRAEGVENIHSLQLPSAYELISADSFINRLSGRAIARRMTAAVVTVLMVVVAALASVNRSVQTDSTQLKATAKPSQVVIDDPTGRLNKAKMMKTVKNLDVPLPYRILVTTRNYDDARRIFQEKSEAGEQIDPNTITYYPWTQNTHWVLQKYSLWDQDGRFTVQPRALVLIVKKNEIEVLSGMNDPVTFDGTGNTLKLDGRDPADALAKANDGDNGFLHVDVSYLAGGALRM